MVSTIRVGILHSLSGTMAISEVSLKDAELMAIAEINQAGGVLGKIVEPVIEDGASDSSTFAEKARKLIQQDKVATIFGGWTSATRKAILPVIEQLNALLWYPVEYEGLECSRNIFYIGACPNQQVEPAMHWLLKHKGTRFYLLGSDYVFPRTVNKLIKAHLKHLGGTMTGEEYTPLGATDFCQTVTRIKQARPNVVFNTLNGDSNLAFYQQYKDCGIMAEDIPIMAVSVCEEELRRIGGDVAAGHYATWCYFQSLDTPSNKTFVENFQQTYGRHRVTSDPVQAAYIQVYLWKQAVELAQSFDIDRVRQAAYGQTLDAPGGLVRIEKNHHLSKPCYIGKILPNGQFRVVFASNSLIQPEPWLGVENSNGRVSPVIIDMLAEVSQAIEYNCQLEQKSRELEITMTELMAANERLQRTQEQLRRRTAEFRKLIYQADLLKRRLSSQIRNSLELDVILNAAVREIRELLDIDNCKFFWCRTGNLIMQQFSNSQFYFELSHESSSPTLDAISPNPLQIVPLLGEKILELNLLKIDDIATSDYLDAYSQEVLISLDLKSLLAITVHTRSGEIGVIICEHGSGNHSWHDSEVELLGAVADQLAIAIDQAKLYEQQRIQAAVATAQAEQLKQALYNLQETQAQLVQHEKLSDLGQLLAGVAHEIKNPVSFIHGNLTFANKYVSDILGLVKLYREFYPHPVVAIRDYVESIDLDFLLEDLPQLLGSMKVGADRIREIVLSLRNFSRSDRVQIQTVDLHEGLETTLLLLRHQLKPTSGRPGIQVIEEYGELPLVECYAGQLYQVFMNILSNAIDALEEKYREGYAQSARKKINGSRPRFEAKNGDRDYAKPTILIRTKVVNDRYVLVQITDNGSGMPEDVKARLFESFFTTKPVGKGTGLGLSISYQIVVEKHGGSLKVESELGKGTTFLIEIPVWHNFRQSTATGGN